MWDFVLECKDHGTVVIGNLLALIPIYDIICNSEWYRPVPASFVVQSTKQYRDILIRAHINGTIDINTFKFLDITNSCIPTCYALPKVHKGVVPPPRHPIISGCGSLTENASQIIDEYLYPHVKSLSSHVKERSNYLKLLMDFRYQREPG